MGSGEGDAIREVTVNNSIIPNGTTYYDTTTDTYKYWSGTTTTWSYPTTWIYPAIIYKYQIKCPVKSCKKMNWLELDKITPCTSCGAKLKAVSEQADFEVPVDK